MKVFSDYIISFIFLMLITVASCIYFSMSEYIPTAFFISIVFPAILVFFKHLNRLTPTPKGRRIPFYKDGKKQPDIFMSVIQSIFTETPKIEEEKQNFEFWEQGMSEVIEETQLYDFCKKTWRRQQHAEMGDLHTNQIFSRNYFTQENRPKMAWGEYMSIIWVLTSRNLIKNRFSGKGGKMRFSPNITVDEAKKRW